MTRPSCSSTVPGSTQRAGIAKLFNQRDADMELDRDSQQIVRRFHDALEPTCFPPLPSQCRLGTALARWSCPELS